MIETWKTDFKLFAKSLNLSRDDYKTMMEYIDEIPAAQPELTDEQSIAHLQSSGWMQRHDKEMYESGLKEQLADDSDSYDSLLPSVQPDHTAESGKKVCVDTISRQAAIDAVKTYLSDCCVEDGDYHASGIEYELNELPPVQPEIIRCKDCTYQVESWCGIKYCEAHGDHIGKDYDYCSNARRKEK